jgi:hypothetical protein
VQAGKVRAVGVSNYSAAQLRTAHAALSRRGIVLASNQVQYSLLHRAPERDGVLGACRELGVTLIAYIPLASGALTGKYSGMRAPLSFALTESEMDALEQNNGARHLSAHAPAEVLPRRRRVPQAHDIRATRSSDSRESTTYPARPSTRAEAHPARDGVPRRWRQPPTARHGGAAVTARSAGVTFRLIFRMTT